MKPSKLLRKLQETLTDHDAPRGLQRFAKPLLKLLQLFVAAAEPGTDLAEYLFRNDARTPLFMLEALSRVYREINDKDAFDDLKTSFKELEDALGRIDYHADFHRQATDFDAPPVVRECFRASAACETETLNRILERSGWVTREGSSTRYPRFAEIWRTLKKAKWNGRRKERRKILRKLIETTARTLSLVDDNNPDKLDFNDLENGVHELRRHIRWFAIYTHAFDGLIQLEGQDNLDPDLTCYFTDKIVGSPFNKLPVNRLEKQPIILSASTYYCYSYVIDKLGDIKDDGLLVHAFTKAYLDTGSATADSVHDQVWNLIGPGHVNPATIPVLVTELATQFVRTDKIVDRLIKELKAQ